MTDESLSNEIDVVFGKVKDFYFSTSYTAKDIVVEADKLGVTTAEYIAAVQKWIDTFNESHKIQIERGQNE